MGIAEEEMKSSTRWRLLLVSQWMFILLLSPSTELIAQREWLRFTNLMTTALGIGILSKDLQL